jgi:Rieske [2Fe-2S] domain
LAGEDAESLTSIRIGSPFYPQDWAVLSRSWYPAPCNLCLHRGTQLSLGWVEDDLIVCPYHGLRCGPDGRRRRSRPSPTQPLFEAWDDPGYRPILAPTIDINSATGRRVEGFAKAGGPAFGLTDGAAYPGRSDLDRPSKDPVGVGVRRDVHQLPGHPAWAG